MITELTDALMHLQCELVAERNLVNPNEISWLQYDILTALQSHALLPSELSVYLGLSRSKLSKSLVSLRKSNYIKQSPGKSDHRELVTSLTDEGKGLLTKIDVGHEHLSQTAQKVFSATEQRQFIKLSQKLVPILREERVKNEQ